MLEHNTGPSQSSQYIGADHKDGSSRPRFVELTNRFRVTVRLFSNRSQMTSKCAENKEVVHEPQASVSLQMFLPHFDIFHGGRLLGLFLPMPLKTESIRP